jgi:hypothetical protein
MPRQCDMMQPPLRPTQPRTRTPFWALLGILCLLAGCLPAQVPLSVRVVPTWAGAPLRLDSAYTLPDSDSATFHTLRFYLSGLQATSGDHLIGTPLPPRLLDLGEPASMRIPLTLPAGAQVEALHFQLGIDSATNVAGALGGDLDPTLGMYWAWQSGYINFKLEGNSPRCPTRRNAFQYHLGGYLAPFASLQTVRLPLPSTDGPRQEVVIGLAIDRLLAGIDLRTTHTVMSPGAGSAALSQLLGTLFTVE